MGQGAVSQRSSKSSHLESCGKISNPKIAELIYLKIFLIWPQVPFIQEVLGVCRLTKHGYAVPKRFRAFLETGPRSGFGSKDTLLSECLSQKVLGTGTLIAGKGREEVELKRIPFNPREVEIPLGPSWYSNWKWLPIKCWKSYPE